MPGGNYSITTRANGTVLTATIYNTDHQNHVDNNTPLGVDGYSDDILTMQLQTDAGEVGTEFQASSLGGELERLRFALSEMKGTTYWYQSAADNIAAMHAAIAAGGLVNKLPGVLTNHLGAPTVIGDVYAIDTANTKSITAIDIQNSKRQFVVGLEVVADSTTGSFALMGIVPAKVTGAVAIGDLLIKSATARALESTGIQTGGNASGKNILAIALTAQASGTAVIDVLLLGTNASGSSGVMPAFQLTPVSAAFFSANFPELKKSPSANWPHYTLGFDTTTAEYAGWTFKIPSTAVFSTATLTLASRQLSVTSGTVGWIVYVLSRGDNEAFDTPGTANTVTPSAVKTVAGRLLIQSKVLNITGWDAGDELYILLQRDVTNDNAAEDVEFIGGTIELS